MRHQLASYSTTAGENRDLLDMPKNFHLTGTHFYKKQFPVTSIGVAQLNPTKKANNKSATTETDDNLKGSINSHKSTTVFSPTESLVIPMNEQFSTTIFSNMLKKSRDNTRI
jgi:hypothetical protein